MPGLSSKQLKSRLIETLQSNVTFKVLESNMFCRIMLDGNEFCIYVKNLSSAHLHTKGGKDNVWRAQLPSNKKFEELKESEIPFIFLGYDEDSDVFATWNPHTVKQRLNEATYVSFYSRKDSQQKAHEESSFVRVSLNNDGEVLIFPRQKIGDFLVNINGFFQDNPVYVAMGSKRRTEANVAYKMLMSSKNISLFAKYLEENGEKHVTDYCRILKELITGGLISCHRKDFLACDNLSQYDEAVENFLEHEDIKSENKKHFGCFLDLLTKYILFLKRQIAKDDSAGTANIEPDSSDTCNEKQKENKSVDDSYHKNGKILRITNQDLLHEIEPFLNVEYAKTIVAVNKVKDYYSAKYSDLHMEFKDWIRLLDKIDWNTCYDS